MYSVNINGKPVSGIKPGTKLIDLLVDNGYKIKDLCGRRGQCATCHVYVNKHPTSLRSETDLKRLTLAVLTSADGNRSILLSLTEAKEESSQYDTKTRRIEHDNFT